MKEIYKAHVKQVSSKIKSSLASRGFDGLLLDNGFPDYYFLDDQPTYFKSNPHFNHLCPDNGQGHVLLISPDFDKPKLYYFVPDDFWHEVSALQGAFWESEFEIETHNNIEELWAAVKSTVEKCVAISPNEKTYTKFDLQKADEDFISELHWFRTEKSEYEIQCIKNANEKASKGHRKAKELFLNGATELEIFNQYMLSSEQRESELPYNSIAAFDRNTAVLHYQFPKSDGSGKTFLIDAGARYNGYCSDITRTYYQEDVHPIFKELWSIVEEGQKKQCSMVKPGTDYVDIHREAYNTVAYALVTTGLANASAESLIEQKVPFTFFPHGIGHPLGLQVHDVAGKQIDSKGTVGKPDKDFPFLRTLRKIQNNDVMTIEPGLYFIPMLLKKLKENSTANKMLNWSLIEDLIPFGGIRIEDNVVARSGGPENLTRPFVD